MHAVILLLAIGQLIQSQEYVEHEPIVLESSLEIPEGWAYIHDWELDSPAQGRVFADGESFAVWAPPGTYIVEHELFMFSRDEDQTKHLEEQFSVTVKPRAPPPPDPDPEPDPEPEPDDEAPFPAPGFAVLILREASDTSPERIVPISISRFCVRNCIALSDGYPFYRVWDDDYDDDQLSNVPEELAAAYRIVREDAETLPWLAISNGSGGWSGPLPDEQQTLQLLKEYAP